MLDRPAPSSAPSDHDEWDRHVGRLCRLLAEEAPVADGTGAVTPAAWQALEASGAPLAPFPSDLGGRDLAGGDDLMALLCRLGAADLSMGRLVEGHVNAVLLVRRYGTGRQVAAFADAVAAGALSGVWGAEGTPALAARRVRGGWELTGGKSLASGAGLVTHPLVPVATGDGPLLMMPVLAPATRADLSNWTPQGMRATATGTVELSGLVVPDDGVVGVPGDFTRQPTFSGGAWRFCAVHLGAAERLVDLLREHLVAKGRDRDPYQLQRVAAAATAVTTARFWIAEAARKCSEPAEDPDTVVAFANLTRGVTERAALDVLELVHRGIGLTGFLRPHPAERIARDLATYLRQPVPDLAMADAARAILASPRATGALWTAEA